MLVNEIQTNQILSTKAGSINFSSNAVTKKPALNIFDSFYKRVNKEVDKFRDFSIFKNLKMCQGVKKYQQKIAFDVLCNKCDPKQILITLNGNKPSTTIITGSYFYELKSKILKNLKLSEEIDFIKTNENNIKSLLLVNKHELFKIIEKNKSIYTSRLGLPAKSSVEEIYTELKDFSKKTKKHIPEDLFGITLGFPPKDSIIFQLERISGMSYEQRKQPYFAKNILKTFHSDKSPYMDLEPSLKQEIEEAINNISLKNINGSIKKDFNNNEYFQFINYTNDDKELSRILNSISDFEENFSIENL